MANNQFTFASHAARIASKIEMVTESGCWLWLGSLNSDGYGQVWDGARMRKAHTVLYEQTFGAIAQGMELDHLCRVRSCCNPRHVEQVTHAENMRRGIGGQDSAARTHCPAGHAYEGENLKVYDGRRHCRECRRLACRRRRERLGLPVGMGKGGRTKAVRWS